MNNFKITTQEEKNDCLMWISDLYKDVHGFRPRTWDFNAMSFEELTDFVNSLSEQAEEQDRQEKEWAEICLVEFKKSLQNVIDSGAGDRKTALRWMLQGDMGDDTELDPYAIDYFTMKRGIDTLSYGESLEKELNQIVNDNPAAFGLAA